MTVQPLLGRPPLLPGESLRSFIARLAKFNNYEPRSILSSLIKESGEFKARGRLGSPSRISQFKYLESLTKLAPYDLYRATAHIFTSILTPPENEVEYLELDHDQTVPLLSQGVVARQLRSEIICQFCPLCLKSATYHRLIWLPLACAACLEHQCLLVNACPKCKARIRVQDIVEATCPKCKTDLTATQVVSVENDCFGLFIQSVIQSWLLEGVSPISASYPLPQQMPRDLYRVIDGLRFCIMYVNQDWPLHHYANIQQHPLSLLCDTNTQTFTSYKNYCIYATACKGIIDWPRGFYVFITAYRKREKKSRLHKEATSKEFGRLYQYWIQRYWKQPGFEFVQEAFNQYMVDNQVSFPTTIRLTRFKCTPELTKRLRYVTMKQAAKLLGISCDRLRLMTRSGQLMLYYEKGKTHLPLLSREEVLEFRDKEEQAIGLQEAMNLLGLSRDVVLDLVQIGLLAAQQSHAEAYFWSFSPSSVGECMERVAGKSHIYTSEENGSGENMLSLIETYKLLHYKLKRGGIAFILQGVAEGRLRAFSPKNQRPQLGTLKFFSSDIDAYVEAVKAEREWIGVKEVARILEISENSVKGWVRAGLISPAVVHREKQNFDRRAIVELKTDIVLSIDARAILGVSRNALGALISQGRIEAIRGPRADGFQYYVFSRKWLLQWRSTRVTLEEASRLLQVSKTRIINWVKQGKLLPLENEAQKPWYFSLQALHVLREKQDRNNSFQLNTLDGSIVTTKST